MSVSPAAPSSAPSVRNTRTAEAEHKAQEALEKHKADEAGFIVHERSPDGAILNAESSLSAFHTLLTPLCSLFLRNRHAPPPLCSSLQLSISAAARALLRSRADGAALQADCTLQLRQLGAMPQHDVVAVLECAGNRRREMARPERGESSEGIQWGAGAVGNVAWRGVRLFDLLRLLGLHLDAPEDASCLAFEGLHLHLLSSQALFGASLPLAALAPQHLVATHANDEALPRVHGGALRAVLPGVVGARWIKWLRALHVDVVPEASAPMRDDYKMLCPPAGLAERQRSEWLARMSGAQMDGEMRRRLMLEQPALMSVGIGSAVVTPREGEVVDVHGEIRGYAVPANGQAIQSVSLLFLALPATTPPSSSLSRTHLRQLAAARPAHEWRAAQLLGSPAAAQDVGGGTWGWTLWRASVAPLLLPPADRRGEARGKEEAWAVVVRASTSEARQEQESPYNVRGFANRSWPVVRIRVAS